MMIEETKAVIFDLDGTLVDSMWMWKGIDIEFLKNYGHDCPPELQKEIEGMSFSETAVYFKDRFGLRESIEDIKAIWREMSIEKYRHQVPLKAGAREFLSHLKSRGIAAGIATSNGREMVDAVMKGGEAPVNDTTTYDNGTGVIPSYLCEPVFADASNYKELLIDSGYYTEADLQ